MGNAASRRDTRLVPGHVAVLLLALVSSCHSSCQARAALGQSLLPSSSEPLPGLCLMGWMLPWNGFCASQPLQCPSVFAVGSLD